MKSGRSRNFTSRMLCLFWNDNNNNNKNDDDDDDIERVFQ